jgi:uncharacterized protein
MKSIFPTWGLALAVTAAAVHCPTGPAWARVYPPVQNFKIAMSDGVRLNTDVYFPQDSAGCWPVLLFRTPYNIQTDNLGSMTQYGMVVVCQDTRGRFGSEGVDRMFRDDGWGPDHQDGLEATRWILAQGWCNGRISTKGSSARGITQVLLAGALPESVRSMSVAVAPADLYEQFVFPGGAFRAYDVTTWLESQGISYMQDSIRAHPDKDAWWNWSDTRLRHPQERTPIYHLGGWFDAFTEGTIESFTGLQERGGPGALGRQKLIIGPWVHILGLTPVGELTFPDCGFDTPNALVGSAFQWLLYWLEDAPYPILELPPIAYYVMGDCSEPSAPGNMWRTADSWPPPGYEIGLFLHAGGVLGYAAPSAGEAPEICACDPQDPVPTLGGGNIYLDAGPYDQRPILSRSDVLVYQTAPLAQPVEATGPVRAELFISSDRTDTDIAARLCDVYPDGRAMLICDGILRARHRVSMASEDLLVPGQVYSLGVDLGPTSIIFNAGHRILLAISGSNSPRFDVNPNTGARFGDNDTVQVAHNAVYHDAVRPSRLVLWAPALSSGCPGIGGGTGFSPPEIRISPNPATGPVRVSFQMPGDRAAGLGIFDTAGRLVRSLVRAGDLSAGTHVADWDGRDDRGHPVGSGVYYLRLDDARKDVTRTITVIR